MWNGSRSCTGVLSVSRGDFVERCDRCLDFPDVLCSLCTSAYVERVLNLYCLVCRVDFVERCNRCLYFPNVGAGTAQWLERRTRD